MVTLGRPTVGTTMIESLLMDVVASALASGVSRTFWDRLRTQMRDATRGPLGQEDRTDAHHLSPESREVFESLTDNKPSLALVKLEPSKQAAIAVLARMDPDRVFADARRRVSLVFKIRLWIALVLAVVLVGALAGVVVSLAMGQTELATGLGVAVIADLISLTVFKPLDKIRENLVDTQRLDLLHLMARQQLTEAEALPLEERLTFQQGVWKDVLDQVAALSTA